MEPPKPTSIKLLFSSMEERCVKGHLTRHQQTNMPATILPPDGISLTDFLGIIYEGVDVATPSCPPLKVLYQLLKRPRRPDTHRENPPVSAGILTHHTDRRRILRRILRQNRRVIHSFEQSAPYPGHVGKHEHPCTLENENTKGP